MGRQHQARDYGLSNVTFDVLDVTTLPADPLLGAVFAFDAIHDQADPARVLRAVFDALEPGGGFIMFDIRASSYLENKRDPDRRCGCGSECRRMC